MTIFSLYLSVYLSIYLSSSISQSLFPSPSLSLSLFLSPYIYLSLFSLSLCLSVYHSVSPSLYIFFLSVRLSMFLSSHIHSQSGFIFFFSSLNSLSILILPPSLFFSFSLSSTAPVPHVSLVPLSPLLTLSSV
jgi:hypothetical protein